MNGGTDAAGGLAIAESMRDLMKTAEIWHDIGIFSETERTSGLRPSSRV